MGKLGKGVTLDERWVTPVLHTLCFRKKYVSIFQLWVVKSINLALASIKKEGNKERKKGGKRNGIE